MAEIHRELTPSRTANPQQHSVHLKIQEFSPLEECGPASSLRGACQSFAKLFLRRRCAERGWRKFAGVQSSRTRISRLPCTILRARSGCESIAPSVFTAGRSIYQNFLTRGHEVVFPKNTAM